MTRRQRRARAVRGRDTRGTVKVDFWGSLPWWLRWYVWLTVFGPVLALFFLCGGCGLVTAGWETYKATAPGEQTQIQLDQKYADHAAARREGRCECGWCWGRRRWAAETNRPGYEK